MAGEKICAARRTVADAAAVAPEATTTVSAALEVLPLVQTCTGVVAAGDSQVRGISPGCVAIGPQADIANPVNVVIDSDRKGTLVAQTLAGEAAGDGLSDKKAFVVKDGTASQKLFSVELIDTSGGVRTYCARTFGQMRFARLAQGAGGAANPYKDEVVIDGDSQLVSLRGGVDAGANYQTFSITPTFWSFGKFQVSDDQQIGCYVNGTERAVSFGHSSSGESALLELDANGQNPRLRLTGAAARVEIGANKVIGARGAAVADVASANATDLATALTLVNELKGQVNTLLARLRASTGHGLIA